MDNISLYTGEEIYRPFWENDSAFLETTLGCSWHKCAFCDFSNDKFSVYSLGDIEKKAAILAQYSTGKTSVFLLGENPFVMDTPKLLSIFDIVHSHMPWMEGISMYARFDDILRKDLQQLNVLMRRGLTHLYIGLESGCNEVLRLMNKGITAQEAEAACLRLRQAGIPFSLNVIPGLGGKECSGQHVNDTIAFLNKVQPARVWFIGLRVWPNTSLASMCREGTFTPLSPLERLEEAHDLLSGLELEHCAFADTTVLDKYTFLGQLPDNKYSLLSQMQKLLSQPEDPPGI